MKKVYETVGVCPSCGEKSFRVEIFEYDLPVEGKSAIVVGRCSSCGFRSVDVYPIEGKGEKELTLYTDEDSLKTLLYLPGNTEILVPEEGIEVRLTPAFKGRITTLEGVLYIAAEGSKEAEERIGRILKKGRRVKVILRNPDSLLRVLGRGAPSRPDEKQTH